MALFAALGVAVLIQGVFWRRDAAWKPSLQPVNRAVINVGRPRAEMTPRTLEVRSTLASDLPVLLHDTLEDAVASAEAGDLKQAQLAYHDALMLARNNPGAFSDLVDLRTRYELALRTERTFASIRKAFEAEEFREGLSMLYRLPRSVSPERVHRACGNGWYDLAIVALRAGRCDEAVRDLEEAQGLNLPAATGANALALAQRCPREAREMSFVAAAESLRFRSMDQ